MKECLGVAVNRFASVIGDVLKPNLEVIVIVSEPHYTVDAVGELIRSRRIEELRFVATPDALRTIAEDFRKVADDAEDRISRWTSVEKETK